LFQPDGIHWLRHLFRRFGESTHVRMPDRFRACQACGLIWNSLPPEQLREVLSREAVAVGDEWTPPLIDWADGVSADNDRRFAGDLVRGFGQQAGAGRRQGLGPGFAARSRTGRSETKCASIAGMLHTMLISPLNDSTTNRNRARSSRGSSSGTASADVWSTVSAA
jgi:hypothetical protein